MCDSGVSHNISQWSQSLIPQPCHIEFTSCLRFSHILLFIITIHDAYFVWTNFEESGRCIEKRFYRFLPRGALYCKGRYCDRMSSVCLSVCPSVRPSVTLVNCDHIGWNSSKIISPLVSLGRSLLATPTWLVCSKGNTPKFGPKVTHPCWFERWSHSIANCGRMFTDSTTVTMESL